MSQLTLKRIIPFKIDSGIALAMFTAYFYFLSYLYEKGYWSVFNIPIDYVSLDTYDVLIISTKIISFTMGLLFLCYVPEMLKGLPESHKALTTTLTYNGYGIAISMFIYTLDKNDPYVIYWCLTTIITANLIAGKVNKDRINPRSVEVGSAQTDISKSNQKRIANVIVRSLTFIFLAGFMIFSEFFGKAAARNKNNFYVFAANHEIVVLRTYGDRLVCGRYDYSKKKFTGKVILVKLNDSNPIELIPQNNIH